MTINTIHLMTIAVSAGLGICFILHFKSRMEGVGTNGHPQASNALERFATLAFIALWLAIWSMGIAIAGVVAVVIAKLNPSILSVLVLLFLGTWLTAAVFGWFAAVAQLLGAMLGRPIPRLKVRLRFR